jgi:hypothetical protein
MPITDNSFERRLNRISAVSPIGLMHRYRQHFFYADLQKGRCELIRSLAPYETLEVVTTEAKVTTTEETITREVELATNTSREQKDSTELTERVASTVARSSTSNISANGSYTAVLWSAGGSVSSSVADSSSKTSENIAKTLNDIVQKQSEQIRKKTTVTTRIAETRSDSITTRHSFQNPTEKPVTYGLYKLGYEVKSVVQDMGPLLVWQTRIESPGKTLAVSSLVDKQIVAAEVEARPITVGITLYASNVDVYGFTIDVSEAIILAFNTLMDAAAHLKPLKEYQKAIDDFYSTKPEDFKFTPTGLSLVDWHSGGSNGIPQNHSSGVVDWRNIKLEAGRRTSVIKISDQIVLPNYFYLYATIEVKIPKLIKAGFTPDVGQGETKTEDVPYLVRLAEIESILEATLAPRDRSSLYFEERKTILARKIATLLERAPITGKLSDELLMLYLKINDIFDVSQFFYDVDTFEYQEATNLATLMKLGRPNYPIISKAEGKAPTGSSLGWTHQVDGDAKRDVFLNAPFAWACMPVRPGKERAAFEFLRDQNVILGTSKMTSDLINELEVIREAERIFPVSANEITVENVGHQVNNGLAKRDFVDRVLKMVEKDPKKITIASALKGLSELKPPELSSHTVYPIVGSQATFVTIDGLAFQEIKMGVAKLDLGEAVSDPPSSPPPPPVSKPKPSQK